MAKIYGWPNPQIKSRRKISRSEAFDREIKGEGGRSSFRKGWGGEAKCRPGPWTLSKWREWPSVDLIGGGGDATRAMGIGQWATK
jgi:hypothetical protein